MKNIDSDLIRGNIDTIILKTMLDGDKYGLDIIKEVEARSNGTYELKQPTLYSCLKRLENQELISSYWLDSDIGGKRHYYKLTDKGREFFEKKQEEWSKSKFIIDNLLSNFNYDEYRLVKKDDYDKIIEGKQFVYDNNAETQNQSPASDSLAEYEIKPDAEEPEIQDETENEETSNDELKDNEEEIPETFIEENNDIQSSDNSESDIDDFNNIETSNLVKSTTEENEDRPQRKYYVDYDEDEDNLSVKEENQESVDDEQSEDESLSNENSLEYSNEEYEPEEDDENLNEEAQEQDDEYDDESLADDNQVTYFSNSQEHQNNENQPEEPEEEKNQDYSASENNILARLRNQDNEEINTYYGNQQSYLNHLNQKNDETVKEINMFDNDSPLSKTVDSSIDEFSKAVKELNEFSSEGQSSNKEEPEESQESNVNFDLNDNFEGNDTFTKLNNDEPPYVKENEIIENDAFHDNYLDELNELKRNNNTDFYNSTDNTDYDKVSVHKPAEHDYDYNLTDSSDASFETSESNDYNDDYSNTSYNDENFDYNNTFEEVKNSYNDENEEIDNSYQTNTNSDYNYEFNAPVVDKNETAENVSNYNFDDIIAKNINKNSDELSQSSFETFTPRYTSENYKEKLNNLSIYSKNSSDDEKPTNEEALAKAKDIETLKAELEQEGIKVKEFKKYGANEQAERTYLLANKINLVRSLILLLGYVFVLSAVYIILNNTSFKETTGFSFKYFLYGFIPFAILAIYDIIMFAINPYRKTPAKYAPRIMMFISIIITVQLLLITYCVNLQLGFYSFTQAGYNHLLWVIPTIISFAPIFATITYMILFYSKNFNI